MRVVIDLFVVLLTMSDDNIFTLLDFSHINYDVIVYMTFLMMFLLWCLVTHVFFLVMAVWTTVGPKMCWISISSSLYWRNCCVGKNNGKEEHQGLHVGVSRARRLPTLIRGAEVICSSWDLLYFYTA